MGIYQVEEFIDRAKGFVAKADENSLRHACLELRFCIEKIVYQKLDQVGAHLPRPIYRDWRPNKALKLLLSFEPHADQNSSMTISVDSENGESIVMPFRLGDYKMFSSKWLNKHYNKLGNFLHMPSLAEAESPPEITVTAIQEIIDEIERVASATMVSSVNSVTAFACTLCGSDIYASATQIEKGEIVDCYEDDCQAQHKLVQTDDDHYHAHRAGLYATPCLSCGQGLAIETIHNNEVKTCTGCGNRHLFYLGCKSVQDGSSDDSLTKS